MQEICPETLGEQAKSLYTPLKYNRKCLGCYFPLMETEAFIEQF